ncbi:hypothetical protein [Haliangium sp.]|uniref:hypothetical protein n=1 Tax=Haliangium sp. TaxID=2663208 RepID=UPI003D104AE2
MATDCTSLVCFRSRAPHHGRVILLAACLAAWLLYPSLAAAQAQPAPAAPWRLAPEIGTAVPIDLAMGATIESPYGLRLGASIGYMPGPYVGLVNEVATGFDFYDQATADLIGDVLQSSLVVLVRAGWRPWLGLTIDAGYCLTTLGGSASSEEVLQTFTDTPPPGGASDVPYDVSSTLHLLRLDVGWTFNFGQMYVRSSVGAAVTLHASTTVDPGVTGMPARDRARRGFGRGVAAYLDDTYTSYVHTPVVSLAVGYRFDL